MEMNKLLKNLLLLAAASALAACGGGGGSSGTTNEPYTITLRAAKTQLPLNIANQPAGMGAYSAYTTVLYVEARQGSTLIPGGEEIFGCNLVGLDSGALYYLDGKSEHEDEKKNPLAYRSVTLGANSGAASFHFHAGNQIGTARITCSVTDPRDKKIRSASVDIFVGGGATGKPASVRATAQAPGYLGSQNNTSDIRNNVGLQAFLMDEANQPVPNSDAANLQVSIRSFGASSGAKILAGNQSGGVVQVSTSGGIGLFSLSSGPSAGVILLELVTDRFDNNVQNGIQDPVYSLTAVNVVDAVASAPLAFAAATYAVPNGLPFAAVLSASGGVPPYSWSAVGGLPPGLSISSSGVISGTPLAAPGSYTVAATVTDAVGATVTNTVTLTVTGALPLDPFVFTINGCSADVNTACTLPNATKSRSYLYSFSASGGDPAVAIAWNFQLLPAWLSSATTGNTGFVTGTPATCGKHTFLVTATRGTKVVTRQVSVEVVGDATSVPVITCP
ncbi:putative Ig domain-containing protein [Acidovorax sp.]|uniref:putative Ig domain-containing protein n=1 Tax=Acidovorax sp. TaxID=1872122 RepID=UPI002620C9BB|nr:putative Ig domain-containing protein [Acidovorax sp.]